MTEFLTPAPNAGPIAITRGSDGHLWFSEFTISSVGSLSTSGTFATFPVPLQGAPLGIVGGPDGNIWFVEPAGNNIGRMTPSGTLTEFPIPTPNSILVDHDGALTGLSGSQNRVTRSDG